MNTCNIHKNFIPTRYIQLTQIQNKKERVKFIFYKISKVKLDIIMDQNSTHKHPYFYVLLQLDCYEEILSLE